MNKAVFGWYITSIKSGRKLIARIPLTVGWHAHLLYECIIAQWDRDTVLASKLCENKNGTHWANVYAKAKQSPISNPISKLNIFESARSYFFI